MKSYSIKLERCSEFKKLFDYEPTVRGSVALKRIQLKFI